MLINDSNRIREAIINKALLIFKIVFSGDMNNELEDLKSDKQGLKGFELYNQGKASEATYTLYIEELLSQEKLGEFVKNVCEAHQANQVLQAAQEELINLLKDLDTVKTEQRSLEPPSVSADHATESVYDAPQQNRISPSSDREIPKNSNETEPQFTFNRCIETLKQFIPTLTDETEQSRFTPKQFIGFVITVLGTILLAIRLGIDKRN